MSAHEQGFLASRTEALRSRHEDERGLYGWAAAAGASILSGLALSLSIVDVGIEREVERKPGQATLKETTVYEVPKQCFWEFETGVVGAGLSDTWRLKTKSSIPGLGAVAGFVDGKISAGLEKVTEQGTSYNNVICHDALRAVPDIAADGKSATLTVEGKNGKEPEMSAISSPAYEIWDTNRTGLMRSFEATAANVNMLPLGPEIDSFDTLDSALEGAASVQAMNEGLKQCLEPAYESAKEYIDDSLAKGWVENTQAAADELGAKFELEPEDVTVISPDEVDATKVKNQHSDIKYPTKGAKVIVGESPECKTGEAIVTREGQDND